MKLFKLNKDTYSVEYDEGALMLAPFRVLWNRDRSKYKEKACKELAYVYFMSDIQSDYMIELDESLRAEAIIKDLKLGDEWKPDKKVDNAIIFYKERSVTPLTKIYEAAVAGAEAVNNLLRNADTYIKSAKDPVRAAKDITATLDKVPTVMSRLKAANKELIEEKEALAGKKKGSQTLNMFEDGI